MGGLRHLWSSSVLVCHFQSMGVARACCFHLMGVARACRFQLMGVARACRFQLMGVARVCRFQSMGGDAGVSLPVDGCGTFSITPSASCSGMMVSYFSVRCSRRSFFVKLFNHFILPYSLLGSSGWFGFHVNVVSYHPSGDRVNCSLNSLKTID